MNASSNVAFKEWAVVVDALANGEQILILRKGGIREQSGEFHADHRDFWLFPTQYHEAEHSVIPSKRPALRELAGGVDCDVVEIQYYAVADPVIRIENPDALRRLQGRHIWTEKVVRERFEFGRELGLQALVLRVYRRTQPERFAMQESYAGCKSWVELERPMSTADLTPVLSDGEYRVKQDEIVDRLTDHALAHP